MNKRKSDSNQGDQRPGAKKLFYFFSHLLCRIICIAFFGYRAEGRHLIPSQSGGLVLSTHQSNFDPVLVGIAFNRRMNFLARKTLFKNASFAWLIRTLDAIEIDREGSGLAGLKETMIRLKRRELVLIFPEGTRTNNGRIGHLKPGFISVARRTQVPLIPVAITGAYEVIPRGKSWPKPSPIAVVIGEQIEAELVSKLSDEELMAELQKRLEACDRRGREMIGIASN